MQKGFYPGVLSLAYLDDFQKGIKSINLLPQYSSQRIHTAFGISLKTQSQSYGQTAHDSDDSLGAHHPPPPKKKKKKAIINYYELSRAWSSGKKYYQLYIMKILNMLKVNNNS